MQAPKRKTSKSKRNMRRSHHALSAPFSVECPECGNKKLPHTVCPRCGHYKNRKLVKVDED